mgnify:FL=1
MKRFLLHICLLFCCTALAAQESDILVRVREANLQNSLRANFTQLRHSPLLSADLESSGFVALQAPDKVHWEVQKPVSRVSVFNGDMPQEGRHFRLPTEKDFTVSALEGEDLTLILKPRRRDLAQLFQQIVLKVHPGTLVVKSVLLNGVDGDWTRIEFTDVQRNLPLPSSLFEK